MRGDDPICVGVLDTIACGIAVLDETGCIRVWNRWLARHSGIDADDALGKTLEEVFPELSGSRFAQAVRMALSHRLPGLLSPSIHRPPLPLFRRPVERARGERLQQLINIAPVRLTAGTGCTLQIQDVSLSVQRERKLREQTDALAAGNASLQARLDEIQALQAQITAMSARDALTGVFNRERLDEELKHALSTAANNGEPLSALLVDVDKLKHINELHGFEAGDAVLKALGTLLLDKLPARAVAGRYDEDQFVVLLPGVPRDQAKQLADQWRELFAAHAVPSGGQAIAACFSAGIASFPDNAQDARSLLEYLKLALFLAKHDGQNCVVLFDSGAGSAA